MKKGVSGQISIFLAILLLSVFLLSGLLVDLSRISAGRSLVKRAVDTSARSLLAEYGSRLKEEYGLFAIPVTDENELHDLFEEYLSCNLSIPLENDYFKGSTDLFGFRIERVSITPIFNLSENQVTKQQILEYMKYRAPASLVEGFIERLAAIKDVGKMSAAYKQKVGIDKILGSMDKFQQKLKKTIDGSGNIGEKFINGFNLGGSWEAAFHDVNSLSSGISSVQSSLDALNSRISELESQKDQQDEEKSSGGNSTGNNSGGSSGSNQNGNSDSSGGTGNSSGGDNNSSGGDNNSSGGVNNSSCDNNSSGSGNSGSNGKNTKNDTDSLIDGLKSERSALQKSHSELNSQLQLKWNEIRYELTEDYVKSNDSAINEIQKVIEKGQKAQEAIAELESYLNDHFTSDAGTFSKDFSEQTQKELNDLKQLILEGKKAEEMLQNVSGNSSLLKTVAAKLDSAGVISGSSAGLTSGLPSELLDIIKGYANISYNYTKPDKGDKKDDPRKGKADAVKEFIVKEILKDVNYKLEGIDEIELPSVTKVSTSDYELEDEAFTNAQHNGNGNAPIQTEEVTYGGNLENIKDEVDLYDEEGMFQENALGFIAGIGSMVTAEATVLRDNVYMNEYIMGMFKNSVSEIEKGDEKVKDKNLQGIEKTSLTTFYDSEVEYILHGNASQHINNLMTKGEILLVRFGLNTLHVYTDGKKKAMATSIATAVAGWWTGGAGIPILSNLIMCGWGMGEAVIDVTDLMEGKSVPIYKMTGDWRLDVGLPEVSGPETDKRLYFNYHDYLRLFLLTTSESKKLDRLEDIIQLNLGKTKNGFKMAGCNTFFRIEAEVSMRYLFITQPFFRREMKTNDERHVFKVLIYEGY